MAEAYGPDSDPCDPIGYPTGVGVPLYLDDLLDVEITSDEFSAVNPTVRSSSTYTGSGTTHEITLPASVAMGDLLVCVIGWYNDEYSDCDWPGGWESQYVSGSGTFSNHLEYAIRRADGTEGGSTIEVTTPGAAAATQASVYSFADAADPDDQLPEHTVTFQNPPTKYPQTGYVDPTGGSQAYTVIAIECAFTGTRVDWPDNCPSNQIGSTAMSTATGEFDASRVQADAWELQSSVVWLAGMIIVYPAGGGPADHDLLVYHTEAGLWLNTTAEDAGLVTAAHDHDDAYISIIGSPVATDFPEMTAGGELSPSGYGPGDFAADDHGHALDDLSDVAATSPDDGDVLTWVDGAPGSWQPAVGGGGAYLPLAGGEMIGGIGLGNAGPQLFFTADVDQTSATGWSQIAADTWSLLIKMALDTGPPPAITGTAITLSEDALYAWNLAVMTGGSVIAAVDLGTSDSPWQNLYLLDTLYYWDGDSWEVAVLDGTSGGLDDLSDVTLDTPADGDLLVYVTDHWENQTLAEAGAADAAHDHTGVYIEAIAGTPTAGNFASITDGDTLADSTYSAASFADAAHDHDSDYADIAHSHALDDISDVAASAPDDGDVLTWVDGAPGSWQAAPPTGGSGALDDLSDVTLGTPTHGDVLWYDTDHWEDASLSEAGIAADDHDHDGEYVDVATATQALRIGPYLGAAGAGLGVSDYVADPSGDLDVRAKLIPNIQWHSGGWRIEEMTFLAVHLDSNSDGWYFFCDGAGNLGFLCFDDSGGTELCSAVSTVPADWPMGTPLWARAMVDIDNGATHWEVLFYTSTDGTNWTQLGTTITSVSGTLTWPDLAVGMIMVGQPFDAQGALLYRVEVRYGGSLVANPHFDDPAEWDIGENGGDSDTADDGQTNTWTLTDDTEIVPVPGIGDPMVWDPNAGTFSPYTLDKLAGSIDNILDH